jgi:M6 family metalloprotease-like protein
METKVLGMIQDHFLRGGQPTMSFPFFGQEFTFTQPDGSQLRVRGWGDQQRAVFQTLDGFTVVRDPVTGFYNYATTTAEQDELRSTGVRAGHADPEALNLPLGIRVSSVARTLAPPTTSLPKPRWKERREQHKAALRSTALGMGVLPAPPARQTVGDFVGVCLLVQFPDIPGTIAREEVEAFCNIPGYSGFVNHGSVFDYYLDNSAGKLRYKTIVAPYYTAQNPRSYYTNPAIPFGERTRDLIKEALTHHLAQGFDFSGASIDDQGAIYATNVFYAGPRVNNWSQGLWPHSSRLAAPFLISAGKSVLDYQITNMGDALTLGTYCHENGHMLCDFPDLYEYSNQAAGIGDYCLMCLGGNADPRNPAQISAYLKYRAGWGNPVTKITPGLAATANAGKNEFFIYAKSSTEYFIIENRHRSGRDAALTDSGLAIWHIDELGSNSEPEKAPAGHQRFECTLVQADGRDDLGQGSNQGDDSDLFRNGLNAQFSAATSPSSSWLDGTPSGLNIQNIGLDGSQMTFEAAV